MTTRAQAALQAWQHLTSNDGVLSAPNVRAFMASAEVTTTKELLSLEAEALEVEYEIMINEVAVTRALTRSERTRIMDCIEWYDTCKDDGTVPAAEDWMRLTNDAINEYKERVNRTKRAAIRKAADELQVIEQKKRDAELAVALAAASKAEREANVATRETAAATNEDDEKERFTNKDGIKKDI